MSKFSALLLSGLVLSGCGEPEKVWTYHNGVITEVGTCTGGGGISITSVLGIPNGADLAVCKVRIKSNFSDDVWSIRPPFMLGENVKIQCWINPDDNLNRCRVI